VELEISLRKLSASFASIGSLESSALNCFFSSQIKSQITLKNDSDWNFWISLSLSTNNLTATDCTLPADNQYLIFCRSTGDNSYQTKRSSTLLAC
jgi:hypothetical protein